MFVENYLAKKIPAITIGVMAALGMGAIAPATAATIYGITWDGILLEIDETTGVGTPIREQLAPQFHSIDSLEFVDGYFYSSYQGGRVLRFAFTDGDEVDLGSSGFPYVEQLAERGDGTVFASVSQNFDVAAESIGQIDLKTGKVSKLVSSTEPAISFDIDAMSFDANNTLYGINLENPRTLFSFDTTDGTIAQETPLDNIYWGLGIDRTSNTFYATKGHGQVQSFLPSELFIIDPTTGNETYVGSIGYANVTGITVKDTASVPEPNSLLGLLVCATLGSLIKPFNRQNNS